MGKQEHSEVDEAGCEESESERQWRERLGSLKETCVSEAAAEYARSLGAANDGMGLAVGTRGAYVDRRRRGLVVRRLARDCSGMRREPWALLRLALWPGLDDLFWASRRAAPGWEGAPRALEDGLADAVIALNELGSSEFDEGELEDALLEAVRGKLYAAMQNAGVLDVMHDGLATAVGEDRPSSRAPDGEPDEPSQRLRTALGTLHFLFQLVRRAVAAKDTTQAFERSPGLFRWRDISRQIVTGRVYRFVQVWPDERGGSLWEVHSRRSG